MESLLYLCRLKAWGFVRNIFKKPLSAVFTVLAVLFFVAVYIAMFMVSEEMEEKLPFELFGIFFLGFSLFMGVAMLFQKRTALLSMSDAHYLLIGPFKRQHIFLSAIMGSMGGALLYGVMAYAYCIAFFSPLFDFQVFDYFWILIVALAIFYFIFILIDFSYIRFLGHTHQRAIRVLVILSIVVITLSVFGYYCLRYYTQDLSMTFLSFITSDLFNFTPFLGWANAAIFNMHNGNIILAMICLGLIVFVDFLLTYLTITTKELDPEIIIEDAAWYEDLRARAKKSGSNLNLNLKVKKVEDFTFKEGSDALSSRLFLEMKKTGSFITRQEFLFIILYFAIAYFGKYSFIGYSRYVSIVLFIITMSANYTDELRHHYIYLIPDDPFKKLIALLKPTLVKVLIIVLVMNTVGLIFKPTILEYLSGIVETLGYGLVFVCGNILCIRILKSGTNALASQFIKMGVIILALLPGILLGVVFGIFINALAYSFISALFSLIVSLVLLYLSRNITNNPETNC